MWHSALRAIAALMLLQPLQLPAPRGYINDFANVIPADRQASIQRIIDDVKSKSGGEIVVVTLPDIGDRDPADVTLQIGRQWKVGKLGNPGDPTRNTGVVILVVPKETSSTGQGRCWVATGYGAEGFVTDAMAGDMCRAAIPFFRQRDYGAGVEQIALQVAQRFASEFHFALDTSLAANAPAPPEQLSRRDGGGIPPLLIIAFIVIIVVLGNLGRGRRGCGGCIPIFIPMGGGGWRGGGWSGGGWGGGGGGGGGGFGGFGGGGRFGGGGGGSNW